MRVMVRQCSLLCTLNAFLGVMVYRRTESRRNKASGPTPYFCPRPPLSVNSALTVNLMSNAGLFLCFRFVKVGVNHSSVCSFIRAPSWKRFSVCTAVSVWLSQRRSACTLDTIDTFHVSRSFRTSGAGNSAFITLHLSLGKELFRADVCARWSVCIVLVKTPLT